MLSLIVIFFLLFMVLFFASTCFLIYKLIKSSVEKEGVWGINFDETLCPVCQTKMPTFRSPTSFKQAMLGGWTCNNCGCEMDKWGKEIQSSKDPVLIEEKRFEPSKKHFDEDGKTPVERVFEENS